MGARQDSVPARGDVEKLSALMRSMSAKELQQRVSLRLQRAPDESLPPLARGEDPTDLFSDCADHDPKLRAELQHASTRLLRLWLSADERHLRANAEPLGDLLYLCARLEAVEAIPAVADAAGRASLGAVTLWGGEDLQNRALRCLAGLLLSVAELLRTQYRPLFEGALHEPHHIAIGLTALCTSWPEKRLDYIRVARQISGETVDEIVGELDSLPSAYQQAAVSI